MTFYIAEFYNKLGNRLYNSEIFQAEDFDDASDFAMRLNKECLTARSFQLFEVNDWTNTVTPIDVIIKL